jgi:hypothetical protein
MRRRGLVDAVEAAGNAVSRVRGHPARSARPASPLIPQWPPYAPMGRPMMQATKAIPIVLFAVGDPVGQGFVASLGRRGGNVTGLGHGMLAKQFELLLQAARKCGGSGSSSTLPCRASTCR